ncbi:MAG: class I SAM-dependent methyltransferase [Candidatus Levyibacteriota bacterium]
MAEGNENNPLGFRKSLKELIREDTSLEQKMVDEGSPIRDNVWQLYEGDVLTYDHTFSEILKELNLKSLKEWMELRKKSGQTTHILDVMGGNGTFLRNLSKYGIRGHDVSPYFDKSLAITLVDERSGDERLRKEDERRGVFFVAGDITSGSTWKKVSEWMKANNVPSFDLVICRGVEGIDNIPIPLYKTILDRFYQRTSSQNGLILSQVSAWANSQLKQWDAELNKIPGIKTITQKERKTLGYSSMGAGYPAIGIVKSNEAPKILPRFISPEKI